jgi:hypothetical protein
MELQDLKSGWQNVDAPGKRDIDLLKMTRIKNHPTLKSIRAKFMIETIFFIFFLTVYYDWFDGDQKPISANILLGCSILFYIANNVIGYVSLFKKINGVNLKASLEIYLSRIRQLSVFSLICTCLYSVSFLLFFTSVIHFTKEKSFLLLGLGIVLIQLLLWSQRIWNKWIKSLQQQVKDLELDEAI